MRMSIILLILLLLESRCISQNASGFDVNINAISKAGILLDKGWKFHAGDNVGWAGPEFNDSNWDTINPSKDIYDLPNVKKAEIGWFRIKLHVDSSLFNRPLSLIISQVGASEIYLNGRLIYRFGNVIAEYQIEKTSRLLNRPFSFRFDPQSVQTLAVRYSFNRKNFYVNYLFSNTCLQIILKDANAGFANYITFSQVDSYIDCLQIALFGLLALMSLFLYVSFRQQIAYFYFGIAFCAEFVQSALHIPPDIGTFTTSFFSACLFLSYIFSIISFFLLFESIFRLYFISRDWIYYLFIAYVIFSLGSFIFSYKLSGIFALILLLLSSVEILRVLIKAHRAGGSGAKILITSTTSFILLFLAFIIIYISGNVALAFIISSIAIINVPIGLAIFLVYEFARTGRSLQYRVTEVEELSRKTVAQEQEKQQLLAGQNEALEQRVVERTAALNQSLNHLKATQSQLIQSEKMASLGELTAGIAHEIQNPLNFVNNFSEVSNELVDEMNGELDKGDIEEAKAIAADIKQNLEKINHHGKRADAIVKGMLQHSRKSSGQKEPTDINALADEYLRLAYQGLRAKDKSFNPTLNTSFDATIRKVNIIPQDIGRVLLNLFNNAFYAVTERQQAEGEGYKPEVSVATKKVDGKVEIRVKDNGSGIPQEIIEKIFQPFFTTKPTGQGTGLGLSLSYDIINAHGGEIKAETEQGAGTTFVIELPLNKTNPSL